MSITEVALETGVSFEHIAKEVGLSPRSLARKFESELGMTWRQAQRRMRMVAAMERLAEHPELPITEVAFSVGYTSLSAFNAAFREQTDMTPTAYRRSLLQTG